MLAGVSDRLISRIGTRMSGREPCTYTLRELAKGCTAASSTRAVWLRNSGIGVHDGTPWKIARSIVPLRGDPNSLGLKAVKDRLAQYFPTTALPVSGSEGISHRLQVGEARTPSKVCETNGNVE